MFNLKTPDACIKCETCIPKPHPEGGSEYFCSTQKMQKCSHVYGSKTCWKVSGTKINNKNQLFVAEIKVNANRSKFCYNYGCNHWYLCLKSDNDAGMESCMGFRFAHEKSYKEYRVD